MNSYPAHKWLLDATADGDGGVQVDRAQDGTARGRELFPLTKRRFVGRHLVTSDELASYFAFYEANKLDQVALDWRGSEAGSYVVLFERRPRSQAVKPGTFQVAVELLEA